MCKTQSEFSDLLQTELNELPTGSMYVKESLLHGLPPYMSKIGMEYRGLEMESIPRDTPQYVCVTAAGDTRGPGISVLVSTNYSGTLASFTIAFVMFTEYYF